MKLNILLKMGNDESMKEKIIFLFPIIISGLIGTNCHDLRPDSSFVTYLKNSRVVNNSEFEVIEKPYSIAFIPIPEKNQWISIGNTGIDRLFYISATAIYDELRILLIIKLAVPRKLSVSGNLRIKNGYGQSLEIKLDKQEDNNEYLGFSGFVISIDEIKKLQKIINDDDVTAEIIGGQETLSFGISYFDRNSFNKIFKLFSKIRELKEEFNDK